MKMLTGLLPADARARRCSSAGRSKPASIETRAAASATCRRSFSLYGELTVRQNLDLHARLFHLPADKARARIDELVERFGLAHTRRLAAELPLGVRQRLSLAVAVVHEPEILILDEPTSGVDPVARDEFWELLIDLSRNQGVTIFVSTHFMNEALRCDRISLMHAGRVLAPRSPAELIRRRGARPSRTRSSAIWSRNPRRAATAREPSRRGPPARTASPSAAERTAPAAGRVQPAPGCSPTPSAKRSRCCATRSGWPSRFSAPRFLMLVFGFGITTDVENLPFAALDLDQSPESRAYLSEFAGSRYFSEQPPIADDADLERRLQQRRRLAGDRDPAGLRPRPPARAQPEVGADRRRHAVPRRDDRRLCPGRAQALPGRARRAGDAGKPATRRATIETRFRYNPTSRASTRWCPRAGAAADPDPGDPDGGRHRPREGAGLDHQLLRHADDARSSSCSASNCPISCSAWSTSPCCC